LLIANCSPYPNNPAHNGNDNAFNEMIKDIRSDKLDYSLHKTTFDEALEQGLYKRICLVQKKEWTQAAQDA
jgi:phage FluMu gp28-like protein